MITYLLNMDELKEEVKEEEKKGNSKKDSLTLQVFKGNDLIRTLKMEPPKENGLHRMYWNMTEKGVHRPTRRKVDKKNILEPSGVSVLPGKYKLVMQFKDQKDSAVVEVQYDPRLEMSQEVLQARYDLLKQIEKKYDLSYRSVEQLKESKDVAEQVKKLAKEMDEEANKDLIKSSDSIVKQIDGLIDDMMGKEDKRQGITATKDPTTISYLNQAYYSVSSLQSMPGKTESQLIENAYGKIDPVIEKINAFYANEWQAYRREVEAASLSPFKSYEVLK